MNRVPTDRQAELLRMLAGGNAGLSWGKRSVDPLHRRGWVTGDRTGRYWQMVRITPTGLRALAAHVERHGLPDLARRHTVRRRVCADCGSTRIEHVEREGTA